MSKSKSFSACDEIASEKLKPHGKTDLFCKEEKIIYEFDTESQSRGHWDSSGQFFVTVLGFCVGLGNIWRFPYLCQKNGGGAFIIPFLIMFVIQGIPLLLLELALGQKFRKGAFIVWKTINPKLVGIGIGSTIIALIVACYYNVIIAWCYFYLFNSLTSPLPWSNCPEILNSNNETIINKECQMSSETQYFWYRKTLNISPSATDLGDFNWILLSLLSLSWTIVYFITMKGVQSSGKIVYITALFPYLVMTIFFVKGLTLEGSIDGLIHMFRPNLSKLIEPKIWLDAATQVFYSYGLALGSYIGFGSYNHSKKNCILDTLIISLCNALTAIYACAVVFVILGFKARHLFNKCKTQDMEILMTINDFSYISDVNVSDEKYRSIMLNPSLNNFKQLRNCTLEDELNEAAQGTGLAFIVMTEVFSMLPLAPLWSVLFFSMLLALGIGSQIGLMEGMLGTIFDMEAFKGFKKPILAGIVCLICYLIGIIFVTGAGEYWVTLFDSYGAQGLTLIALTEVLGVMYVYGHERFTNDIYLMTGKKPGWYWQIMWRFISPLVLFTILVASAYKEITNIPTYTVWIKEKATLQSVEYPPALVLMAIVLAMSSVIPFIGFYTWNSICQLRSKN